MAAAVARKSAAFALAALLAAVLLYYSLRGIEWREVGRIIGAASPGLLALAVVFVSTTLFLRACRWRVLLNAEGRVGIATAFWANAAGSFGNNFLPARAGELVRTYFVGSRSRLGNAYVLATVICERIADVIALALISAIVLLTLPSAPGWFGRAARPFALLALIGAAGLALLPLMGPFVARTIGSLPLSEPARARAAGLVDRALVGLRTLHDGRRIVAFAALTALIWTLDAIGTMIGGAALGLSLPLPVAFLLVAGLGLGSTLPSTPGYVGIYQFVAVSVLTPFGFARTEAIAYILVAQAMMYVVIGVWGSIGLLRYRRSMETDDHQA
jgi:glycosyltransferase 2 family protein